jgi:CRISPR/Cas system Type II protein with McrA/HNH and RuvC-like nuclease domain
LQRYLKEKREKTALLVISNKKTCDQIDAVFSKREEKEREIEDMEEKIKKKQAQYDEIVKRLVLYCFLILIYLCFFQPTAKQQEYYNMQKDKKELESKKEALTTQQRFLEGLVWRLD